MGVGGRAVERPAQKIERQARRLSRLGHRPLRKHWPERADHERCDPKPTAMQCVCHGYSCKVWSWRYFCRSSRRDSMTSQVMVPAPAPLKCPAMPVAFPYVVARTSACVVV